jgi:hypothetical protein
MKRLFSIALVMGLGWQGLALGQDVAAQETSAPIEAVGAPVTETLEAPRAFSEKLHQNQWVQVDSQGRFTGSVVSLFRGGASEKVANAQVALLRGGRVVASTMTNLDGDFLFNGILPGNYTIEGLGTNGTFSFALHVLSGQAAQGGNVKIYAVVPGGTVVTKYFARFMTPSSPVRNEVYGVSEQRVSQGNGQISLDQNGAFRGNLMLPGTAFAAADMSSTEVILLQNGREVVKSRANADGSFTFNGLATGVYGLVAAGPVGRAAVAFELVDGKPVAQQQRGGVSFVAIQDGPASSLNMELAPPATGTEEELVMDEMGMPMPGGGMAAPGSGGFGGGGSGGGGSAGGIGDLLGIAGLAGAVVALTDDDNTVASPIQ